MQNDEIYVSIIVPVYNVLPYIEECVASLVNQTLSNIQLVFVDNGCEDSSMDIVNSYIKEKENVDVVILEKNVGLPQARNIGMKHAKGKYLAFVDSDDLCDLTMFEKMYKKAEEYDADVVICNVASFEEKSYKAHDHHSESWYCEDNGVYPMHGHAQQWMEMAAWAKLVRKEYASLVDYKFTAGSLCCEEVPGTTRLLLNTRKIVTINETLYFYRNRPNSLSKKTNKKFADDFVWAMQEQDEIFNKKQMTDSLNLYYVFLVRLLLANHILSHMNKKELKYSISQIRKVFEIFPKRLITSFCSYNHANLELIEIIMKSDYKEYKRWIKGVR